MFYHVSELPTLAGILNTEEVSQGRGWSLCANAHKTPHETIYLEPKAQNGYLYRVTPIKGEATVDFGFDEGEIYLCGKIKVELLGKARDVPRHEPSSRCTLYEVEAILLANGWPSLIEKIYSQFRKNWEYDLKEGDTEEASRSLSHMGFMGLHRLAQRCQEDLGRDSQGNWVYSSPYDY